MSIRDGVFFMLMCGVLFLFGCAGPQEKAKEIGFEGNWQGHGIDSNGNEIDFAAKVISQGDSRYQILILDSIEIQKEPMHIMDGVLKGNDYEYTSDGGIYVGGGKLDDGIFKGYYKGPVDGTFTMQRVDNHMKQ